MSTTRLFLFLDDAYDPSYPIAVVEVADTGDDLVDEKAALDRFAEHYGWDTRLAATWCAYNSTRSLRVRSLARGAFCPLPRT